MKYRFRLVLTWVVVLAPLVAVAVVILLWPAYLALGLGFGIVWLFGSMIIAELVMRALPIDEDEEG